jgi:hypothetical protein
MYITYTMSEQNDKVMSSQPDQEPAPDQLITYQIRIQSHLDFDWADWFEGLTITLEENGDTLLTGPVADQAALYGLLKKVRDLGMPLISVNPAEPSRADVTEVKP